MGCQTSYLMITIPSKKKQKNWGSKIKRIENELEFREPCGGRGGGGHWRRKSFLTQALINLINKYRQMINQHPQGHFRAG